MTPRGSCPSDRVSPGEGGHPHAALGLRHGRGAKGKGCEHPGPGTDLNVDASPSMRPPGTRLAHPSPGAAADKQTTACGLWGGQGHGRREGPRRRIGSLYDQLREFTNIVCQHPPQEHDIHV